MTTYSYKVCYKRKHKKLKIHLVTNNLMLANLEKDYYIKHPQYDRKTHKKIKNAIWCVKPVKTLTEHQRLWKDCPF